MSHHPEPLESHHKPSRRCRVVAAAEEVEKESLALLRSRPPSAGTSSTTAAAPPSSRRWRNDARRARHCRRRGAPFLPPLLVLAASLLSPPPSFVFWSGGRDPRFRGGGGLIPLLFCHAASSSSGDHAAAPFGWGDDDLFPEKGDRDCDEVDDAWWSTSPGARPPCNSHYGNSGSGGDSANNGSVGGGGGLEDDDDDDADDDEEDSDEDDKEDEDDAEDDEEDASGLPNQVTLTVYVAQRPGEGSRNRVVSRIMSEYLNDTAHDYVVHMRGLRSPDRVRRERRRRRISNVRNRTRSRHRLVQEGGEADDDVDADDNPNGVLQDDTGEFENEQGQGNGTGGGQGNSDGGGGGQDNSSGAGHGSGSGGGQGSGSGGGQGSGGGSGGGGQGNGSNGGGGGNGGGGSSSSSSFGITNSSSAAPRQANFTWWDMYYVSTDPSRERFDATVTWWQYTIRYACFWGDSALPIRNNTILSHVQHELKLTIQQGQETGDFDAWLQAKYPDSSQVDLVFTTEPSEIGADDGPLRPPPFGEFATPIDPRAWDWRRWVGLGLFLGTVLVSSALMQLAACRHRALTQQEFWANLGTEQGVDEILQMGWKLKGSQMEIYDKAKVGYLDDESILLGGYEQREPHGCEITVTHPESETTPEMPTPPAARGAGA